MKKNKSKTVVVKVTALDIKKGEPGDATACPIYWAAKSMCQFGLADSIEVGTGGIELTFDGDGFGSESVIKTIPIPKKAQTFIDNFDDGIPVKPFSFRIRL